VQLHSVSVCCSIPKLECTQRVYISADREKNHPNQFNLIRSFMHCKGSFTPDPRHGTVRRGARRPAAPRVAAVQCNAYGNSSVKAATATSLHAVLGPV